MKTTICGNYPKIDYRKSRINLRTAINRLEGGRIDQEEYESVLRQTFERTVNDQIQAGLDIVTDGQISWLDLFSPYCDALENVSPGGLRRFFDNNVYFRRPQITGEISRSKAIVAGSPLYSEMKPNKETKAVLCGPVTFALFCDDYHYGDFERLATAVAGVIHEEALTLRKRGVQYLQLDEPGLPAHPENVDLLIKLLPAIFDGIEIHGGVAFYFESLQEIAARLGEFPVDFLALDLVSHPEEMENLPNLNRFDLHAGLVDARNIMLEEADEVLARLAWLEERTGPREIVLTTSCGLEFLPRDYALAKMRHLTKLAAEQQVSTNGK